MDSLNDIGQTQRAARYLYLFVRLLNAAQNSAEKEC